MSRSLCLILILILSLSLAGNESGPLAFNHYTAPYLTLLQGQIALLNVMDVFVKEPLSVMVRDRTEIQAGKGLGTWVGVVRIWGGLD